MTTQKDVRCSLKALPDTLTEAYDEIYTRIAAQKGSAPRLALTAFRWMQWSYEPLQAETLLDAITVEIDASAEFSHYTLYPNDLLKACQNFLILDEGLNVFRFAHLSVNEYLETKLCKVNFHTEIAKVCLSLLCTPSWDDYGMAIQKKSEQCSGHLLWYSAKFWPWHFAHCGDGGNDCQILTGLWDRLVSQNNHQRWLTYHRESVPTYDTYEGCGDTFGRRSRARHQDPDDDVLSSVCVFGLGRKFKAVFELKPIKEARIRRLLLQACRFGDLEIAQLLVGRRVEVTAPKEGGKRPLHIASYGGHEMVARLLIDRGANISAIDKSGRTPLHFASKGGHGAVARLLIDHGADIAAADAEKWTSLHCATEGGHDVVTRLLVDRKADVSAVAFYDLTPLHLASSGGHEALARLIIDQGADVSAVDYSQQTPLHQASSGGHETVARLLVDRRADVFAADSSRWTPLHYASRGGHEAVARFLVDQRADVSAVTLSEVTPLHLASERGHGAVAQLLIDHGADISAIGEAKRTSLHYAIEGGHEEVVRLLIDRGAEISAIDTNRRTPLHIAALGGYEALARTH